MTNGSRFVAAVLLALAVLPACAAPPTMADVERWGTVVELTDAQLYIPSASGATDGKVDVVVHFHGGLAYLAREIERHGFNTVLVYYSPGGFSSAYRKPFEDQAKFAALLEEARAALRKQRGWPGDVTFDDLVVTSFSAGYGAVRELLKNETYFNGIDAVLLCDSLYAGYVGDDTPPSVNPDDMAPFVKLAEAASGGRKVFWFTHSTIVPPGYAGTHETADYLARTLALPWHAYAGDEPETLRPDRTASRGGFTLIGADGDDATAHVAHLHEAGFFLSQMNVLDRRR